MHRLSCQTLGGRLTHQHRSREWTGSGHSFRKVVTRSRFVYIDPGNIAGLPRGVAVGAVVERSENRRYVLDWMLEHGDLTGVRELRVGLRRYLGRHGSPTSDVFGAEVIADELVTNAVIHTDGLVWVSLDWTGVNPSLRVADLGPGLDLDVPQPPATDEGGRGLLLTANIAEALEARMRAAGGTVVTAVLPVMRAESPSIDSPRHRNNALPHLSEAAPAGAFSKEPFLRALVVQMAQAVAEQSGPDAAEQVVAQVAADVGGQMEAEYRAASGIVDRLTPAQLADCFVRLKHAIDGNFTVTELSDTQIILESTTCPFGDVVRRAPALCRMTSSVFGGMAARNSEQSAEVILEERIAIGDHRCRIVVNLDPDPEQMTPWAHRYNAPR